MGVKENRDLILHLYEKAFHGPATELDRCFAPGYRDHTFWGDLEGLKRTLAHLHEALPNLKWKISDIVAEQDRVAARGSIVVMSASGPSRKIRFMSWFKIRNGRIVEQWGFGDPLILPRKK